MLKSVQNMVQLPVRELGMRHVKGPIVWAAWLLGFVALAPSLAVAQSQVTLAWDPSPDSAVIGYMVYQGPASGTYTNVTDVGTNLTVTVSLPPQGSTNYVAVTAYLTNGLQGPYSSELKSAATSPAQAPVLRIALTATNQVQLSATGLAGRAYDVLAGQSLTNLTTIGTVTADASGNVAYTDSVAPTNTVRYYRLR
jgi:hypothetical protein